MVMLLDMACRRYRHAVRDTGPFLELEKFLICCLQKVGLKLGCLQSSSTGTECIFQLVAPAVLFFSSLRTYPLRMLEVITSYGVDLLPFNF